MPGLQTEILQLSRKGYHPAELRSLHIFRVGVNLDVCAPPDICGRKFVLFDKTFAY